MAKKTLAALGRMVRERRGAGKLREVAAEIGIGAATLMRVENGRIPDLGTFAKLCKWLNEDPSSFLGLLPVAEQEASTTAGDTVEASAHLKADQTPQADTVKALAAMILLAAKRQRGTMGQVADADS
jgi:transcriptional regulator with XRE-family HTH domain